MVRLSVPIFDQRFCCKIEMSVQVPIKIVLLSVVDACFTSGSKKYETVNVFEFEINEKYHKTLLKCIKYNNVHM